MARSHSSRPHSPAAPVRGRAGVAALAAGVAAVGQLQVRLEGRGQGRGAQATVGGPPGGLDLGPVVAERARVLAIHEDEGTRPLELDNPAERLGAEAA